MSDQLSPKMFYVQNPVTKEVRGPGSASDLKQWFSKGGRDDWGVAKSPNGPWRPAYEIDEFRSWEQQVAQMKVTTGDLNEPYEIIGPVYFSVSNKGLFFNQLGDLIGKYRQKLADMKSRGTIRGVAMDWGFLYGEFSVGQSQFDSAFFVAVEELKQRAGRVGGDAIVHMRQDIDIDTSGMQFFYLQMYGTAVKVKQPPAAKTEET